MQWVHPATAVAAEVPVHDLCGLDGETRRLRLRAWIEEEQATPFDWSRPPLVRLAALALDERRFALGVAEHHSVLDGWSLQSLGTSCWRSTPTFSPVSSRGKRKRPR